MAMITEDIIKLQTEYNRLLSKMADNYHGMPVWFAYRPAPRWRRLLWWVMDRLGL